MALLAISDLHIGFEPNRRALEAVSNHPDDWLILAGDVGETVAHLAYALDCLTPKFARLIWVPGNHELWSRREEPGLRGDGKYRALVAACRARSVLTPEDPYPLFSGLDGELRIAPVFTLYDYSFTPTPMTPEAAVQWAIDQGVLCGDEAVLHCEPHSSRAAWCAARCDETEQRLTRTRALDTCPLVLVGHFPFLREHAELPRFPAFRSGAALSGHALGPDVSEPRWSSTDICTVPARDVQMESGTRKCRSATLVSGLLHRLSKRTFD